VRRAEPADAEAMARVHWLSSNTAYGRNDPFERRLAASHALFGEEGVRPFVAEHEGEVVGVLTVGDTELYAIYVHPDHWGTGVGQALLDAAHDELAQTCEVAELTCLVDNARARRFYERNGWEPGEQVTEVHFGGELTDVVRYRTRLPRAAGKREDAEPTRTSD
jgi:RimJ/RimL family protein N-acetyltransferase